MNWERPDINHFMVGSNVFHKVNQPPLVVGGAGVAVEAVHEALHQAGEPAALGPSPPPSTSTHAITVYKVSSLQGNHFKPLVDNYKRLKV